MWLHYTTLDTKMFDMAKINRSGETCIMADHNNDVTNNRTY